MVGKMAQAKEGDVRVEDAAIKRLAHAKAADLAVGVAADAEVAKIDRMRIAICVRRTSLRQHTN